MSSSQTSTSTAETNNTLAHAHESLHESKHVNADVDVSTANSVGSLSKAITEQTSAICGKLDQQLRDERIRSALSLIVTATCSSLPDHKIARALESFEYTESGPVYGKSYSHDFLAKILRDFRRSGASQVATYDCPNVANNNGQPFSNALVNQLHGLIGLCPKASLIAEPASEGKSGSVRPVLYLELP